MNLSISGTVAVISILLIASKMDMATSKSVAQLEQIDLSHFGSRLFGEPSKDVGLEVENWKDNQKSGNPEELGSYLEGDILFPRGQSRNGLIAETYRWPDAIIPFEIVGDYGSRHSNQFKKQEEKNSGKQFCCRCSSNGSVRESNQFLPRQHLHQIYTEKVDG